MGFWDFFKYAELKGPPGKEFCRNCGKRNVIVKSGYFDTKNGKPVMIEKCPDHEGHLALAVEGFI